MLSGQPTADSSHEDDSGASDLELDDLEAELEQSLAGAGSKAAQTQVS